VTTITDRAGLFSRASKDNPVDLELGCGANKRHESAFGIDALDLPGVDVSGDVLDVLRRLPDASVANCYSSHFLEHVSDLAALFSELARVIRPGGTLKAVVPHFSNPHFYSDYTHSRFFGLYSFSYLCVDRIFRRKVPTYGRALAFELVEARLVFKSDRAFPVRRAFKAALGYLLNATAWIKEAYEENLCYLFPCYEVEFVAKRLDVR
jgi:ubiquinone/menaquinone biosynthesis C-methylase UbiE